MKLKINLELIVETNTDNAITTSILQDIYSHFNQVLSASNNPSDYCDVEKINVRSIIRLENKNVNANLAVVS